jgi:hypothetical protein
MSALPRCRDCQDDRYQRLIGESQEAWLFGCLHCKVTWLVSKPATRARAAADRAADLTRQATEFERQLLARRRYFT